jgi:hypothetical protein
MAFTNSNDYITGRKPVLFPAGCENVTIRFDLAVAVGDLALNTIGQVGILPAGCVPVEVRVDGSDVDSGAGAGVYQVGLLDAAGTAMSAAAADGGGAWGDTGAAVATAFDKPLTRTLNNMASVQSSQVDRKLGLKVTTAPSTAVAGTIGVTLTYRPA